MTYTTIGLSFRRYRRVALIACLTVALAPFGANAMILLHLPAIDGGVDTPEYEKWISLNAAALSVDRELKESGEKGGTQDLNIGIGELSLFSWTQDFDQSYSRLFINSITGNALAGQAEVHFFDVPKAGGKLRPYLKYIFDRPFIKSVSLAAEEGGPTQVTGELFFNKVAVQLYVATETEDYHLFHQTGWDLVRNVPWNDFSSLDLTFNVEAANVPLPAAAWFLVSALGVMGATRRKRT